MRTVILLSVGAVLVACTPTPAPESCGNGLCVAGAGETCATCPTDCRACAACGNGLCTGGETCATCPSDCGACAVDAGPGDAGGTGCEIQAGRWVGSGDPDPSSTDPLCTTQSFDRRLSASFFSDFPASVAMCPSGCTCAPVPAPVPPTCDVNASLVCSPTSSSGDSWWRTSPTVLQRVTTETSDRGTCTATWTLTWFEP